MVMAILNDTTFTQLVAQHGSNAKVIHCNCLKIISASYNCNDEIFH